MNFSIDWQGIDHDGIVTYFDFFPLGISFLKIKDVSFLYIWLLFWVVGITWSIE
jgi:hypothetical protein